MYRNMARLSALPEDTLAYCAHEYTLSNGKYAIRAEPQNHDIALRLAAVEAMRERGEATVPTTIGQERATNPFMRAATVEELARRRAEKDKG
jgi:hydroxyacylglutathione hydrolase